ncbi:MAG: amidase, partial [Longimicrobiales bacterium]|nr:amidase [Longimicrobiales bacterium]
VWRAHPAEAAAALPGTLPDLPGARARPRAAAPEEWTVAETLEMLRTGDASAVEVMEAHLALVRAWDDIYQAFNHIDPDAALARAREIDSGRRRGPLAGVPLAMKDNYFTAGIPTTANSWVFDDFVPEFDAEAWARLQAAGAVLVGKTQMGPLATTRATTPDGTATTVNAWDPRPGGASPGGSSSGSATAVAGRLVAGATGTQTGGSITNPSDAQGLTGLKPTMGRVSLRGIIPLTYTRDHPGPLARDAIDAAILLQTMAGPDPADPRTLGLPEVPDLVVAATPVEAGGRVRLRWPTTIGVPPGWLDEPEAPEPLAADADEATRARHARRMEFVARSRAELGPRSAFLDAMRAAGAEVREVELPEDWDTLTGGAFNNVRLPERSEPFIEALRHDVRDFGVSLGSWIHGLLLPATEYLKGQRARELLLRRVLFDLFAQCDVVVQTSPIPFDIIGLPLITFPVGFTEGEAGPLPSGVMLGGHPFAEDRLLSIAAAWQATTDHHRRRPPLPDRGFATRGTPERLDVQDAVDTSQ